MALDDGIEEGGLLAEFHDGLSSSSSEHEEVEVQSKCQHNMQLRQPKRQNSTDFFVPEKRKCRNMEQSSSSFRNSDRRSSLDQNFPLPRMKNTAAIGHKSQPNHSIKRRRETPVLNGHMKEAARGKSGTTATIEKHHDHKRQKTNSTNTTPTTTSGRRPHRPSNHHRYRHSQRHHLESRGGGGGSSDRGKRVRDTVARLPPPSSPQQQHLFHGSSDTTTSTTKHLRTNNTTTATEITSNVHLKQRAYSAHLSICSDTAEHRLSHDSDPQHLRTELFDPKRQSFHVQESTRFLSLIEGIEANVPIEKYVNHVLEGPPYNHPKAGRMIELPCEAAIGQWATEIAPYLHSGGGTNANTNAINTNKRCFRIRLRHQSCHNLESLKTVKTRQGNEAATSGSSSRGAYNGLRGAGDGSGGAYGNQDSIPSNSQSTHNQVNMNTATISTAMAAAANTNQLTISEIHPAWNRVLGTAEADRSPASFIGSLSVISFEGFTSTSDMNQRAAQVSSELLARVEKKQHTQTQQYPCLLGVQSATSAEATVGISAMCGFSLDQDYNVLLAQDGTISGTPVVALDILFWISHPDQSSSAQPSSGLLAESNEEEEDDPFRLTEQSLKTHTLAVRSTPYDPFQRLWGNLSNYPSTTHSNNKNKRPLDIPVKGIDISVSSSSSSSKNNKKTRNNSPPLERKRIKIQNANAFVARANKKASNQTATENAKEQLQRRKEMSNVTATNHYSRMVTPHVPKSQVLRMPAQPVPIFRQTKYQHEHNSSLGHYCNLQVKDTDGGTDGDDDEFHESSPISHDDDAGNEGVQNDEPPLIMTKSTNHRQQQEPTLNLKSRVSSRPRQQEKTLQQKLLLSTSSSQEPPPLLPSFPRTPYGEKTTEMTIAITTSPQSNHSRADESAEKTIDQQNNGMTPGVYLSPHTHGQNRLRAPISVQTPGTKHLAACHGDIHHTLAEEKTRVPPVLPMLFNHDSRNILNSPATTTTRIAEILDTNADDDTGFSCDFSMDDKTLDNQSGKKTGVRRHPCRRPRPRSLAFLLASVLVLLFLDFPSNYDSRLPNTTMTSVTHRRRASIRSRSRRHKKSNGIPFPLPYFSILGAKGGIKESA